MTACWAQRLGEPSIRFRSDGEDPIKAGAREMLEAVCPGRVTGTETIGCFGCPREGESINGEPIGDGTPSMQVRNVVRGHFLSPKSDDALLWTSGCVAGANGFTYLVSRRSGKWEFLEKDGADTSLCQKVPLGDGRDGLVCLWKWYWQLGIDYHVAYHDYRTLDHQELYTVTDGSQNCGESPLFVSTDLSKPLLVGRTFISGVDFEIRQGRLVGLSVIVNSGQKVFKSRECSPETIPTRPSRVWFSWTGTTFQPISKGKATK
jgi:hypothetical protein